MKSRSNILLACALLCLALRPASGLDFFLDLSSHTEGGAIRGYGVSIHLDASFEDFDDPVDGFTLISPGGDLVVAVTTESLNDSFGLLYPDFASATGAMYGDWTLISTVFGIEFESETFNVRSSGLALADLAPARITSPPFNAINVAPNILMTFTGPIDAAEIGLRLSPETGSYPNEGIARLPGNATQYSAPYPLNAGTNEVLLIYYLPPTVPAKVTIESPSGVAWSSLFSRASVANSRFTVRGAELRLSGPERVGNQFRWSFDTEAGRTYDVEFNDDLNTTNWQVQQTINGDGSVKTFTVSPTGGARFFRVSRR